MKRNVDRPAWCLLGSLVFVAGVVFTLQGVGLLKGSTMSNTTTWSILGPLIAIGGALLFYRGLKAQP